jgi:hypothetical protein
MAGGPEPHGLECRFNRGCEPLPPSINSNLSRHRLKVQERKSLNSSVGFFKSKTPYPVNFGIENDDIGAENTYSWDVYQ